MSQIFPHQTKAFDQLHKTAQAFFDGRWHRLPVQPRFTPLILGPTGSGKTHMVRHLAAELSLPLLEISSGSWVLLGCSGRGGEVTWPAIVSFCRENETGIIFLDECDKLYGPAEWTKYLRMEVFGLLDRTIPKTIKKEDVLCFFEAEEKLKQSIFLVAAGAFQSQWESKTRGKIGFDLSQTTAGLTFANCAENVPPEIIYRFSQLITLTPMNLSDYRQLLDQTLEILPEPLKTSVRTLGGKTIDQAVVQQLGCRWTQQLIEEALIASTLLQPVKSIQREPEELSL